MKQLAIKLLAITGMLLTALISSNSLAAGLCTDPLHQQEVCFRMKHMRSTINAIDAQRELMRINYDYLGVLASSLKTNSTEIVGKISMENPDHVEGLKAIGRMASDMESYSKLGNPNAVVSANMLRSRCVSCHTNDSPPSGVKWGDVFKYDWEKISKNCNLPGRNPYLCKSMNGMLSAYGQLMTAYIAGIKNFELTEQASTEVVRILQEIKKHNFLHMSEAIRAEAEAKATEIVNLAKAKDESVFEKSYQLPQTCMKCHEENGQSGYEGRGFSMNVWSRK
jgi:hypothetical protein